MPETSIPLSGLPDQSFLEFQELAWKYFYDAVGIPQHILEPDEDLD